MKIFNLASLMLFISLTGCSDVKELYTEISNQPMDMVISPGYKVELDGEMALAFGFQECPKPDPIMVKLFGPTSFENESTCIVITPETKAVNVLVVFKDRRLTEEWTVIFEQNKKVMRLNRPNGNPVGAYVEKKKTVSI